MEDNKWEDKMDEKLRMQSEFITSLLATKMSESEANITKKIYAEISVIKKNISDIDDKVNRMDLLLSNTNSNIQSLNAELSSVQIALSGVKNDFTNIQKQLTEKTNELFELKNKFLTTTDELNEVKCSLHTQENRLVACDAFLSGIPHSSDENLKSIFNSICHAIGIKPPTLQSIFRTRPKTNSNDTAIMVKFASAYERNYVLKSIAAFRKKTNRQLCLRDAGYSSDVFIYLRESLSQQNKQLLQHALQLKKHKQLASVYTARGCVYVKRHHTESAVLIDCIDTLEGVARLD